MYEREGGRVRRNIGARKTCLWAIDPEDIGRRLTVEGRSSVCSASDGPERMEAMYSLGVGGKILDEDSRVPDRIGCERGCVPPGHYRAQSLSRLADRKRERTLPAEADGDAPLYPPARQGWKTRQPCFGGKRYGPPSADPRLAFIGILQGGLGCGEFLFNPAMGHEPSSFRALHIQTLMIDCRVTPNRSDSLSRDRIIQEGKAEFTLLSPGMV